MKTTNEPYWYGEAAQSIAPVSAMMAIILPIYPMVWFCLGCKWLVSFWNEFATIIFPIRKKYTEYQAF